MNDYSGDGQAVYGEYTSPSTRRLFDEMPEAVRQAIDPITLLAAQILIEGTLGAHSKDPASEPVSKGVLAFYLVAALDTDISERRQFVDDRVADAIISANGRRE